MRPARNFIFRNPARNCTIIIAYCVNNLQCIGYFLLTKKKINKKKIKKTRHDCVIAMTRTLPAYMTSVDL